MTVVDSRPFAGERRQAGGEEEEEESGRAGERERARGEVAQTRRCQRRTVTGRRRADGARELESDHDEGKSHTCHQSLTQPVRRQYMGAFHAGWLSEFLSTAELLVRAMPPDERTFLARTPRL